jgi:hypothetical protein
VERVRQSLPSLLRIPKKTVQLSKFWIKACICKYNDLPLGTLQSRKWRRLCKMWSVSCGLIKPNVYNERNDAIVWNMGWIHLLSHCFSNCGRSRSIRWSVDGFRIKPIKQFLSHT